MSHVPQGNEGSTREIPVVAPENMPEDPPDYGEDGLHMLNDTNEYLADEVVVDETTTTTKETSKQYMTKKVSPTASSEDVGLGRVEVDDFKHSEELDIAGQIIARNQRIREERLWQRRHPSNPVLRALQVLIPYGGIA